MARNPEGASSARRNRLVGSLAVVIAVVGALWLVSRGANRPADPSFDAGPTTVASSAALTATTAGTRSSPSVLEGGVRPAGTTSFADAGFGEIEFAVVGGDGRKDQFCGLLADDEKTRGLGMMRRRDMAGHDAMLFRFPTDSTGRFFMRTVPVPLDIAWFAADGSFVSSTTMPACGDRSDCPLFGAARSYRYAVETLTGGLTRLGLVPGSRIQLLGRCSTTSRR